MEKSAVFPGGYGRIGDYRVKELSNDQYKMCANQ